jgi:hypothetical protein
MRNMSDTIEVVVGSTNPVLYRTTYGGVAVTPATATVVLTDAADDVVTLDNSPSCGTDGVSLRIEADEVPAENMGETWKLTVTWTYTPPGGSEDTRRDVVYLTLVEDYTNGSGILCTLAQVKERIGLKTTESDAMIQTLIAALTPIANVRYGREFMQTGSSKRTFMVRRNRVDLAPFDLRTATLVRLHPEADTPLVLAANVDYALAGADSLTDAYSVLRLSNGTSLTSTFAGRFDTAQIEITGAWGLWASTADVPLDINQAAVECVLAMMNRPTSTVANVSGGSPREIAPAIPATWDFPFAAHVKFQPYSRNFGVY